MAGCGDHTERGIANEGYVGDSSSRPPPPSHVQSTPHEEFGVPESRPPDHSATSVVGDGFQHPLPSTQGQSDRGENASTDGSEESVVPGDCRYCCWKPSCLQRLASGRCFVFFLSLLSLTEAGLTVGYISSMVTSFELQFRFNSTLTGFVVSCYDIGTLVVILTSYFGGREAANRPKWIAWSAWAMAFGSTVLTLPHFFIPYKTAGNDTTPAVCHDPDSGSVFYSESVTHNSSCTPTVDGEMEGSALFFLIPGMLLIGAGSTATLTLGATYIDDFARKKEAPILLAILFSTTVIGPAVGFLIGSSFLRHYVDFDNPHASHPPISPSSPQWVGAWWLGFFFFAGAILIMAIPVYAFPAKLRRPGEMYKAQKLKNVEEEGEDGGEDDANVRMAFSDVSLTKIPLAIWGLLKNPVYMMINVASAAEFSIVTGFVRFAPKFIQSQFELRATTANLVTGTLIPVGALGVILGGIVLNRVRPSLMSTVNVLSACTILSGLMYGLIYIPGPCPNTNMAGLNVSYFNESHWHRPSDPYKVNFTSPCNAGCDCDVTAYRPVCSWDNLTSFFNPCFAGCTVQEIVSKSNSTEPDRYVYFNCSCVESYDTRASVQVDGEGPVVRTKQYPHPYPYPYPYPYLHGAGVDPTPISYFDAESDLCKSTCNLLLPFMGLLLLVVFFSAVQQMPALMTILRCVKKEERPFALGLQFVILRLVGYIPSPIYYGAVIDSTCILWQRECDEPDGACLMYDNAGFFYRYLGLSTLLKGVSLCMAVLVWLVVRRMHTRAHRAAADATPEPSTAPRPGAVVTTTSEDSGIFNESRKNDRLSDEISAAGHFRYTDEVQTIDGSIEQRT